MTESAQKLFDLLHERRMLPDSLIESLRKQVAAAPRPLEAHHIAKLLQQKGKITAYQARELLAATEGRPMEISPSSSAAESTPPVAADVDLGLALIEEDIPKTQRQKTQLAALASPLAEPAKKPTLAKSRAPIAAPPSLESGVDDLLSDPLLTQTAGGMYDPLGIAKPPRKPNWLARVFGGGGAKQKPRSHGWESPLILVGGGTLLLLTIVGTTLALVLLRSSGEELFKAAEADYSNGLYSQAIGKYEKFLRGRANHPRASLARVRIGVARLRTAAGGDGETGLRSAQAILPTLNHEPALAEVRAELAGVLPGIAEEFADAAAKSRSIEEAKANVERYRETMRIIDEPLYLPTSVKTPLAAQLANMQEKIDAAVREIEQDRRLHEAIATIQTAAQQRDYTKAYATQHDLLQLYPRLRSNEQLLSAVAAISATLGEQVRAIESTYAPHNEEAVSPIVAEIALAKPAGEQIPQLAKRLVPLVVDGVVYVLSAADGRLLWRRFVGRDVETAFVLGDPPDVVVSDARRQELLRLRGADGKLIWRLPVAESLQIGPHTADELWLTLASGKLLLVDLASGSVKKQIEFPQPLAASASLSGDGKSIFQAGEHSNLYVLDTASLACRAVHYLGHKTGEVQLPPQMVGSLLVAQQQSGLHRTLLHALVWNAEDDSLVAAHAPVAVEGRMDLPLLVDRNRAVAIDQGGAIRVLEADDASGQPSLTIVAEKSSANDDVAAHAAIADGLLVVGDARLAAYRVRNARGALPPVWANHDGDRFVAPLYVDGGYLFHARQQKDQTGVVIAAIALASDEVQAAGRPIWETRIALGGAGSWQQHETGAVSAWCATGDVFDIDLNSTGFIALNRPAVASKPLANSQATHWRDGTITPGALSQLQFIRDDHEQEPNDSAASVFPFQPSLRPGQQLAWLPPVVIDDQRFIAVEEAGGVYVIHLDATGAPHLAALRQTQLHTPLVAAPAINQRYLQLVARNDEFDSIVPLDLSDLQPADELALPGRVVWGPANCGDLTLVATDPGGLIALRAPASQVWICDLAGQCPAGSPLPVEDTLMIATSAGRVLTIALDTGELRREINFAQPLASGPIVVGDRIAVRAADAAVLIAEVPR